MPMRIVLLMSWTGLLSSVGAFHVEQRFPALMFRHMAIAFPYIERAAEEVFLMAMERQHLVTGMGLL
jgi:hypothetical protein